MPVLGCGAQMSKLMDVSDADVAVMEDTIAERLGLGVSQAVAQRQAVDEALAQLADERSAVMKAVQEQLGVKDGPETDFGTIANDLFPDEFATKDTVGDSGVKISSKGATRKGANVNSDGKQITATKQGVDNFWKWFGDSAAADAKGRPLVMYHSTNSDFNAFEPGRETVNSTTFGDVDTQRHGVFMSPDNKFSQEYLRKGEGQNVMQVYASLQNPIDLREGINGDDLNAIIEAHGDDGLLTHRDFNYVDPYETWQFFDDEFGKNFVNAAKAAGFDGAIMLEAGPDRNKPATTYVAFDANQVKSATGNQGSFSQTDDRIAFSNKPLPEGLTNLGVDQDLVDLYNDMRAKRDFVEADPEFSTARDKAAATRALKKFFADAEAVGNPAVIQNAIAKFVDGGAIPFSNKSQTDTPEFKRYFGDSKVVDSKGKPLVVYHSTNAIPWEDKGGFSVFDTKSSELGSHFGTADQANSFGSGDFRRVMPVFLAIKNPLRLKDYGRFSRMAVPFQLEALGMITADKEDSLRGMSEEDAIAETQRVIEAAGYDGVVYLNRREGAAQGSMASNGDLDEMTDEEVLEAYPEARDSYIAFEPSQIKSAIGNNGNFDPADPRIEFSNKSSIGYYSALADSISALPTKQSTAQGWKDAIKGLVNKGTVKQDEVEWTGLTDWLDLQEGKVTREQIGEYLDANGVQVQEVTLGNQRFKTPAEAISHIAEAQGMTEDEVREQWGYANEGDYITLANSDFRDSDAEGDTKYSQYTLPGGQNYREVLLTLPGKKEKWVMRKQESGKWEVLLEDGSRSLGLFKTEGDAGSELDYVNRTAGESKKGQYQSSHWDQKNVLAHIRMNDRTDADGKRVLFVEEVQSDWGQEGKKKGFANPLNEFEKGELKRLGDMVNAGTASDEENQAWADLWGRNAHTGAVPVAPFINKTEGWLNLALKRIVTMAAEGGYDRVAFVNGEQSADRYDLSKQIEKLTYSKNDDGTYRLSATDVHLSNSNLGQSLTEADLENHVGKDVAKKIVAGEGTRTIRAPGFKGPASYDLKGLDLKVGGEGMKTFYDKIVPNAVKALLKKVGGGSLRSVDLSVEDKSWPVGNALRNIKFEQPGFDVTDAMREKAEQGMPLFANKPRPAPLAASNKPTDWKATSWRDKSNQLQFKPGAYLYGKLVEKAAPMLNYLGLKTMSPELKRQVRQMKLQVEQAQELSASIAKETAKMTPEERNMVSDLVEKTLKPGVVPPAHAIKLAAMINTVMEEQTDKLVALGMLTKDSADRWRGVYLPRFYETKLKTATGVDAWGDAMKKLARRASIMKGVKGNHLKSRGIFETIATGDLDNYEALGWEVRDPDFKKGSSPEVQVWRDLTPKERADLGEIRDAGFRFVMGYMQTQKDIALGEMFERMEGDASLSSRLPTTEMDVRVPDSKVSGTGANVYGKMAGRYVSEETLSHLTSFEENHSAAVVAYRQALSLWKEGKTVLNPVSHLNNTVSNMTMAHLAGVSYHRGDKYLATVMDFMRKDDKGLADAKAAGLFLGSFNQAELAAGIPDELKAMAKIQDSTGVKVGRGAMNLMTLGLRGPMGKAYEFEDSFYKYMIYKDARSRGMSQDDSVDYAQKYIFTYDDLPSGARKIRDFAIPFFSYTYKAVPCLLETALTHPLRMAAPAALLWSVTALGYAVAAGADDDEPWYELAKKYLTDSEFRDKANAIRADDQKSLPTWMRGNTAFMTPKTMRVGFDKTLDLPVFLDVSRLIPGGDLFDVAPNAGGLPLPQPLNPSHPVLSIAMALLGNKDLFSGKDLTDKNDTNGEAAEKRLKWIYSQVAPAVAVGNYHFDRAMNMVAQASGGEIKYVPEIIGEKYTGVGRDGLPVEPQYGVPQTFGIKVKPIDLEKSQQIERAMDKKLIMDIDAEMRQLKRLNSQGVLSDTAFEKATAFQRLKKERLKEGLTVDGNEKD